MKQHQYRSFLSDEQSFGELAQSIKSRQSSLKNSLQSNAGSFVTVDNFTSIINEEFLISYEVLENKKCLNWGNIKLLKIENTSFFQTNHSAYCVIVNINSDSLRNRIQKHLEKVFLIFIEKFSFSLTYIDFTTSDFDFKKDQESLSLSNSINDLEYDRVQQFILDNKTDCRFLIFSQHSEGKLIDMISDYPYVYCCSSDAKISESIIQKQKLHQSFSSINFSYSSIRQIIPTAFSLLQDFIYVNIKIEVDCAATPDDNLLFHPLFQRSQSLITYDIPYVIINNFIYLPIPLVIKNILATDKYAGIPRKLKYSFNHEKVQDIEEYWFIFTQLKHCYEQLTLKDLFYSIQTEKEEQFYSVNSMLLRVQKQQFSDFENKYRVKNDKVMQLCDQIEILHYGDDTIVEKLVKYSQLRSRLLYRMRTFNYIHYY